MLDEQVTSEVNMAKLTQKDISNKIRELINPQDNESGILPLLRILASKSVALPQQSVQPMPSTTAPTIPDVAYNQKLMDQNSIAAKYPYLGAR